MNYIDLSGLWQCDIPGQSAPIRLPGTLDESCIGCPTARISSGTWKTPLPSVCGRTAILSSPA